MVLTALVLSATVGVLPVQDDGRDPRGNTHLATVRSYPYGIADDVRRPGQNGMLWSVRPILGAIPNGPYPVYTGNPGAEKYGAYGDDDHTVWVKVGGICVTISPWDRITATGLENFEQVRGAWLRENGYLGGVRTVVNDLYHYGPQGGAVASKEMPKPVMTIDVPEDMPRFRSRMQVDATPAALPEKGEITRISVPSTASPALAAKAAETAVAVKTEPTPAAEVAEAPAAK